MTDMSSAMQWKGRLGVPYQGRTKHKKMEDEKQW